MSLVDYLHAIESGFEQGSYNQVMDCIQLALQEYPASGALKVWQALTLEALGRSTEAIQVIRPLCRSPEREVADQARYLLRIWQAPRLRRHSEWLTEIPDLSQLADAEPKSTFVAKRYSKPANTGSETKLSATASTDPNSADNRVTWILLVIVITITTFVWGVTGGN